MYKGIYIAASGAVLKQTQLETLSQNIANANTAGYKKDVLSFQDHLLRSEGGAVTDGRVMSDYGAMKTDLSTGHIVRTGNPLDIAIDGEGMIALDGDRYTRRGDLRTDRDGYLAMHSGVRVLGLGGPIQIPADASDITIDAEGKVSVMQPGSALPSEIDTIRIVEFGPDAGVTKTGDGLFTATGAPAPSAAGVKQGYLESSNVEAVQEMVRMITTMREFESYQKIIQVFDEATAKVNNDLGRL